MLLTLWKLLRAVPAPIVTGIVDLVRSILSAEDPNEALREAHRAAVETILRQRIPNRTH
jgi:hypothetical protein